CGGVSRPIPAPPQGQIIPIEDNTTNTGGFSKGRNEPFNNACPPGSCSNWYSVSSGGYNNGSRYWTFANGNTLDYWARWQPGVTNQTQGWYEVQVYIPGSDATSWQVPYTIQHAGGTTRALIDQVGSGNRWISLGHYRFTPSSASVHLTDATGTETGHCSGTCRIGVDAVRFVRLTTYLPDVRSSSNGWETAL